MNKLITFNELPYWYRDNDLITNGYRKPNNCTSQCVYSIFNLHNETFNIWSHIIGIIQFMMLAFFTYFDDLFLLHKFILYGYCLAVIICFIFSVIHHTMIPHSEHVHKSCLSLDYLGIIFILFATTSILIYKCFYDREYNTHKIVYIMIMGVILYLLSTLIYTTNFISPEKKHIRIILFSLACLFTLIPVIHSGYIHSFNKKFIIIVANVMISIILISIGLYIYINRFPESKYKNDLFNYIGNSHNIWHVMSIITLTVHFYVIKYVLKYLE